MLGMYPAFAMLVATDLERARAFYQDKLGLEPVQSPPGVALFSAGEGTMIVLTQGECAPNPGCAVVGFTVRELDRILAELKSRQVEQVTQGMAESVGPDGIAQKESMRTAWVKDSEGNIIALNEMLY